jgi:tetratricopeptide (TPR) repeat protein
LVVASSEQAGIPKLARGLDRIKEISVGKLSRSLAAKLLRMRAKDSEKLEETPALVEQLLEYAQGRPQNVLAIAQILNAGGTDDLVERVKLLHDTESSISEIALERTFDHLSAREQYVLFALAIHGVPVSVASIDAVIRPDDEGVSSRENLRSLEGVGLVSRGTNKKEYVLAGPFRSFLLERLDYNDGDPFLRQEGFRRAADHWSSRGLSTTGMERIRCHLIEFDLRIEQGRPDCALWAVRQIAPTMLNIGEYHKLEEVSAKALAVGESASLQWRLDLMEYRAEVLFRLGRHEDALQLHDACAHIMKESVQQGRSDTDLWRPAVNAATCAIAMNKISEAIQRYEALIAPLPSKPTTEQREARRVCLSGLATAFLADGVAVRALALCDEALDAALDGAHDDNRYRCEILATKTNACMLLERGPDALTCAENALELVDRADNIETTSLVHFTLARAHLFLDHVQEALTAAKRAVESKVAGLHHERQTLLGIAALRNHDTATAQAAFDKAIAGAESALEWNPNDAAAALSEIVARRGSELCECQQPIWGKRRDKLPAGATTWQKRCLSWFLEQIQKSPRVVESA